MTDNPDDRALDFLSGGGEMGALMRSFDWSKTALGPVEAWPQSLRSAVSICLPSKAQIILCWGPELITLYNDGYRPVFGAKHPHVLGLPVREAWRELWPQGLKEYFEGVLATGEAFWANDLPFSVERHGYPEEAFFDVSYDPVRDESGKVGGIFCIVNETTARVVGERRLRTLRDLGTRTADAKTVEDVFRLASEVLNENTHDLPFSFYYIDGQSLGPGAPPSKAWPIAEASSTGKPVVLNQLDASLARLPGGPWPESAQSAVVLPIVRAGAGAPHGFLVAGVSPRRRLDADYLTFFQLVASQIAAAVANVLAYEEEKRRAEALAEIDRAKTAFFSNVSHEFRTPLTLMLGPLEELKDEFGRSSSPLSIPQYQQIDLVHRNGLRLLKLVNTLLDFSRIEAGRVQAVYEPTDLSTTTAELASVFRSAVEKAGLKLIVDCPPLSESGFVDREMWEKIVLNLMSNAFKFTFEGEIEVKLRKAAQHFELAVRDTGTGIPSDELPKLFERFHRVAGAQGRTHEGSGIGLALVQELIKLHGGSVSVESAVAKGSIFRVAIPLGHSHLPAHQIGARRTQASTALGALPFVEEALRWLPSAGHDHVRVVEDEDRAITEQADSELGERARILLADDNSDMRDYVSRLLAPRYEVEVVADGEAALTAIARKAPDLLLADIMMPRLDGIQLLARLRADAHTSTLPVILLSARAGEESRVEGMQAGADDYLIKPFSARELRARVAAHVKMARFRHAATEALRESEARFRHMADNAPVMIWVTEPDASYTFLSKSWYDFTGQTPATGLGLGWLNATHPDDLPSVHEAFLAANARREPFRLEYRLRRKDGEYRWSIDAAAPRFDETGQFLGYIGSIIDITERKQAEQTQQLLVNELNHRVKNTLASVQAIVQHTLRRTSDPAEFVNSFAGRIQSMAQVHTLLSAGTWQGADLGELIRHQLVLGAVDESRITTRGPSVRLEAQMTLHMAMMVHELGTNSLKHGALSVLNGRVTINWTVEDGSLHLRWQDSGGPEIGAPTKRGFGTTLIEQSAKGEGGDARMSVGVEGVVWQITLPLPRSAVSKDMKTLAAEALSKAPAREQAHLVNKPPGRLAGKRFMVVEDEPLVAMDVVAGLEEAGAEVVASTGAIKDALAAVESKSLDAALLDANLHGRPVDEIAAALTRRNIPFLFVSGYGPEGLPRGFGKVPIVAKPFSQQQLLEAAARLFERRGDVVRLKKK